MTAQSLIQSNGESKRTCLGSNPIRLFRSNGSEPYWRQLRSVISQAQIVDGPRPRNGEVHLLPMPPQHGIAFDCAPLAARHGNEIHLNDDQLIPTAVIVVARNGDFNGAAGPIPSGTYVFLTKPVELNRVLHAVQHASNQPSAGDDGSSSPERRDEPIVFQSMVTQSPRMKAIFETVGQVADVNSTVLIEGETGTGKELLASAIHQTSASRRDGQMVAVNCAALPESLLESELFGHEVGAFTGAVTRRVGRFEQAHNGTILLDEIGEIPPAMQAKLLRVLQER